MKGKYVYPEHAHDNTSFKEHLCNIGLLQRHSTHLDRNSKNWNSLIQIQCEREGRNEKHNPSSSIQLYLFVGTQGTNFHSRNESPIVCISKSFALSVKGTFALFRKERHISERKIFIVIFWCKKYYKSN